MKTVSYIKLFLLINILSMVVIGCNPNKGKQHIIINDYEQKPNFESWWRDNGNVAFSYDETPENQLNADSKVCLHIRWDSLPTDRPYAWFTDLKADTFAVDGMEAKWEQFQEKTWLSFYYKAGKGDTLMLHYLVLSKGHKSKWGAKQMVPATAQEWTFMKVKFSDLQYDDWGKVVAPFDLTTPEGRCFEVGLRLDASPDSGYVEAWFDNIKLTNFEPYE